MIGSPRIDDEIIYSWGFNSVECFDSTPSAIIIILDEDLESFSSLRSQQFQLGVSFQTRSSKKLVDSIHFDLYDLHPISNNDINILSKNFFFWTMQLKFSTFVNITNKIAF